MCSREDQIPGNAGVKDIVLALRWIRDNIVAFKGNPHRVVVAGQSFGAAMVEALTLSSMARGLYHGIILQSGTVLAPWAFNYDAKDKTEYMKLTMNGTHSLLNSAIPDVVFNSEELDVPYYPFGMCKEEAFKNEERLLSEAPFNSFIKGKFTSVPTIIGYNSNEAYVFVSMLKHRKTVKKMERAVMFLLPMELQSNNEREMHPLSKQLMDTYFKDNMNVSSMLEYHR
ncbi:acetylcholinesterase-like [Pieris rapae]|uniref:acetylcholinesterase-like n=1 Tax=Pieris rapae TaxID=64459 RepID=UPI001E27F434|nr:acetylcholinesterase-like [Pieris rapae]